jgi:hypothetical protein
MKKSIADYWKALDLLHPKHRMAAGWHEQWKGTKAYCSDDTPNGHGNFGCERCDAIIDIEERRGIKIWPRHKKVKR